MINFTFKEQNSYKESSDHLDPMETSVELLVETCPLHVQPLSFMPQTTNSESIKQ
jgi:hypothetical protein